jgi:DNA-binding FadR family transcriptional regulator
MAKKTARTASETIAEQIRSRIARGQLKPGDMLPSERLLLEQYDVARPTMRGALRILESDGLVAIERGRRGGARIVGPDIAPLARRVGLHLQLGGADIEELLEVQAVIQPGAAALAAGRRDAGDLARLRAAVDHFASPQSVDDFLDAVTEFTDALFRAAHNAALRLFGQLTSALVRDGLDAYIAQNRITLEAVEHRIAWSATQFVALIDLLEAGDAEGAEAFWRECLQEPIPQAARWSRLEMYGSPGKRPTTRPTSHM